MAVSWHRQASWLVLARMSTAATQVALLALIARVAGPGEGSQFVLALAVTAPLFLLADLGLRTIYITMRPRVNLETCLVLRVLATALAAVIGTVLCRIAYPHLAWSVVVAVVWIKSADLLLDLFLAPLQELGRAGRVLLYAAINGLLSVGLTSTLLLAGKSTGVALTGSALASTVMLGVCARHARTLVPADWPSTSRHEVARLIGPGLGMGTAMAVAGLAIFVPQYVLEAEGRDAELLVFVLLSYGIAAAQLLVQGVTQAAVVELRAQLDETPVEAVVAGVGGRLVRWTVVLVGVATPGVLTLPWVLPAVLGEEYQVSSGEVVPLVLSLATIPAMAWGSAILSALNAYRVLWVSNLLGTLVVLVSGLLLVPVWPLGGAVLSVGLGFLTRALVANWRALRMLRRVPTG